MNGQEASQYFELGCEYRRQGRNREAITAFEHVVQINPENYPAWNNMANAQDDLGNQEAAIESWHRAVKVKPDYDVGWHNLGRALLRKSKFKSRPEMLDAIACLRSAVRAKPDKHESWALLGVAHNVLGELDEAEDCLTKALRFGPEDAETQDVLAKVRKKKRETEISGSRQVPGQAVRQASSATGILQKGNVYSINLTDGSGGLFRVLVVNDQTLEVLPINAAEPSRFAGGPRTILASAVVSFADPGLPWSSYGEGGHREAELGTDKNGGGCFIASAVYGSDQAPQVQVLRTFRDEYLLRSTIGRRAVHYYYRFSPPVAVVVSANPRFTRCLKMCLDALVRKLDMPSRGERPGDGPTSR